MTPVQRLADYIRSRCETNQVFENLVANLIDKERRTRIQDYNTGYADAQCNHVNDAENYVNEQNYLNHEDPTH
jgi:hypothetical protein